MARVGAKLSVMSFVTFGSALSLRRFARMGSSISVHGIARLGASMSLLDCANFGSSISLRSFARVGRQFAVSTHVCSVRILALDQRALSRRVRPVDPGRHPDGRGAVGQGFRKDRQLLVSLRLRQPGKLAFRAELHPDGVGVDDDKINFGDTNSYTKYVSTPAKAIETFVDNTRGISVTATGGVLHGTWTSDNAVTTSDRRLKKSIMPLYKAIAESANKAPQATSTSSRPAGTEKASTVGWVLRQLRPVSFKFKHGPESKQSRYGFVAQELQQVLPSVVRGQGEKHLTVVYQDLIALLTLAAQVLQDRVNQQEDSITNIVKHLKSLDEKIEGILAKQQDVTKVDSTSSTLTAYLQKMEEKLEHVLLRQQQQDERNAAKKYSQEVDDRGEHIRGWPHAVQI
eukprot:CAMPEP_0171282104 /NCGR_PEP_ID=MMETSP0790-20130122/66740_1 /TAXON_ID=2925 /ORGANISM="Alexandrium catenella, Strain OF101" /LENGTH=399 /DNA_ID=CAMNT_0011751337 /DNA_START=53 /DNA_END=1253 /DNA_ORIENTATION=-